MAILFYHVHMFLSSRNFDFVLFIYLEAGFYVLVFWSYNHARNTMHSQ